MSTSSTHVWLTGPHHAARPHAAAAYDPTAMADCHRRLRGPYTGAGSVLRALVPQIHQDTPDLTKRHIIEILAAAPELEALLGPAPDTLTTAASLQERTRWYSPLRTRRIAHGIVDFLHSRSQGQAAGPLTLAFLGVDHADATDLEFLSIALRRLDPTEVRLIVGSSGRRPVAEIAEELDVHASRTTVPKAATGTGGHGNAAELARAFVASDGISDEPGAREAYENLDPQERARLHDARAEELEGRAEQTLHLGAIPYHRLRGSRPRVLGRKACAEAAEYCIGAGYYAAGLELSAKAGELTDPDQEFLAYHEARTDVARCLALLDRPAESEPVYYDLLSRTTRRGVHMSLHYALSMLYTRIYDDEHKDHHKARSYINTAIALAEGLPNPEDRAFHSVFAENGKALVEKHLKNLPEALRLVTEGIARLERELRPDQHRLHRSVLHHNRAQVLAALGRPQEALEEFDHVVDVDPYHPEYRFDRGNLHYQLGHLDEALCDYEAAIRLSPPFPEVFYNRGDLHAARGDTEAALRDFAYVLDLEPDYVEARISLASLLLDCGDPRAAAARLCTGLALTPDDARLHCTLGLALLELDDHEQAEAEFDRALALDPELYEARVNRAVIAQAQGDHESALRDLTAALQRDPGNADLLYNRGFVNESAGHFGQAVADYSAALAAPGADRAELLYRRGRCHAALGRTAQSRSDFTEHDALGPSPHTMEIRGLLAAQGSVAGGSSQR